MPEKSAKVVPYRIIYICDVCGKAPVVHTGVSKSVSPPLYEHICENIDCRQQVWLKQIYPGIRFVAEDEQSEEELLKTPPTFQPEHYQ